VLPLGKMHDSLRPLWWTCGWWTRALGQASRVHWTVQERMQGGVGYAPRNLLHDGEMREDLQVVQRDRTLAAFGPVKSGLESEAMDKGTSD
jgi:hypothetical protein